MAQARQAAEQYKDELMRRGVFLLPLPLQGADEGTLPVPEGGGSSSGGGQGGEGGDSNDANKCAFV